MTFQEHAIWKEASEIANACIFNNMSDDKTVSQIYSKGWNEACKTIVDKLKDKLNK